MKTMVPLYKKIILTALLPAGITLASSFTQPSDRESANERFSMPYKAAGLTDRQAAAHLLDRFAFGASPEEIDRVTAMGPEAWFIQQLSGRQPDPEVEKRLQSFDALSLSNAEVLEKFPRPVKILQEAVKEGYIKKDSTFDRKDPATRKALQKFMRDKGYRPQAELFRQFAGQKIIRAAYGNNALHEVLTEFWFNHFNVSITKNQCAPFIPAYERDVIRPHVAGKFEDLLLATAKSPAMLFYLDNFSSSGTNEDMQEQREKMEKRMERRMADAEPGSKNAELVQKLKENRKNQGLNENYAREIMELHTLGVDGGYTQADVTEAARVLTGWSIYPMSDEGPAQYVRKMIEKAGEDRLESRGFVHDGDFFFIMSRHDTKSKKVLGTTFTEGGGYDEGLKLIHLLAHHPSTAKFISRKLAVRFVSDEPPASLVDKMAASFLQHDGDISEVLKTMVQSPEFWSREALREKTKSPFELAISSVKALKADVNMPFMLYQYISRMGQKLYYYQAPTGFPDNGQYWINAGALLNRMNFGLDIAAQKIPGVKTDLAALNHHREPESAEAALATYAKILMPERDLEPTLKRLTPLVQDPAIQQKISEAAGQSAANNDNNQMHAGEDPAESDLPMQDPKSAREIKKEFRKQGNPGEMPLSAGDNSMLAQVVGIILGSPEFQRK